MWFNFIELDEKVTCSLCKEMYIEGYIPKTQDKEEFEKLEKIFEQDVADWFVCEECVCGFCGVVPDSPPDEWLERQWKKRQSD